jgi:hypothetical protein
MVDAAVIVIAEGGDLSPLATLGGVSLLKRAVLTAQKAGATTCYLCLGQSTDALRHEVHSDPRVTSQIVWVQKNPGANTRTPQNLRWGHGAVWSMPPCASRQGHQFESWVEVPIRFVLGNAERRERN